MWHYENFCREAGVETYPGEARVIGACLSLRASESRSVSMVEKLHAAIAYEHKLRFEISPTEHPTLKLLMKSIRRNLSLPRSPVTPLNLEHLLKLNEHLRQPDNNCDLVTWRTVWRLNVEYYTLCRFSEVNQLTADDLKICETPEKSITIFIRKSKTDQAGLGEYKQLYSVKQNPKLCPVRLTQQYLKRLSEHTPGTLYKGYLQPKVRKCAKLGIQIPLPTSVIGYSSCLEECKHLLSKLGITGRFGEHSGRRGGATAAAANGGSIEDVQALGGWKSATCANKYVEQTATRKEKISKLLYP